MENRALLIDSDATAAVPESNMVLYTVPRRIYGCSA
jgi:hypothetical protein